MAKRKHNALSMMIDNLLNSLSEEDKMELLERFGLQKNKVPEITFTEAD